MDLFQPQQHHPEAGAQAYGSGVNDLPGMTLNKDGLIRMLLQNATPTPMPQSVSMGPPPSVPKWPGSPIINSGSSTTPLTSPKPMVATTQAATANSVPVDVTIEDQTPSFIHQISGTERDIGLINLDHSYSKPWNWKPDVTCLVKPTRTLFVPRVSRNSKPPVINQFVREIIDVESVSPPPVVPYEIEKAKRSMEETERFVDFANPNVDQIDSSDDWEEAINKDGWIPNQQRLFNKVAKIIHADQLARLVHTEPIQRRLIVDKTAKRLRQIFASILWDTKMTQWLHSVLVENLPKQYLAAYIDALQTLKAKVPALVDKMMAIKTPNDPMSTVTHDGMKLLMRRPWNPALSSFNQQKLRKIPGNPILVLTPSGPSDFWSMNSLRFKHWKTMLSNLGRLVVVSMPAVEKSPGGTTWTVPTTSPIVTSASGLCLSPPLSPKSEPEEPAGQDLLTSLLNEGTKPSVYLQHMVSSIYTRVRDLKRGNPDRPIILVGFGIGAAINCHVASLEMIQSNPHSSTAGSVAACVCLGFPIQSLDGPRGEPDDPIMDLKTPVLFVVGENASQCRSDDLEDLRERMRVTTGMVMVGGADDLLRVNTLKKRLEGVTQSMVDRCIMDEVREFLCGVLTSPPPMSVGNNLTGGILTTKGSQHEGGEMTTSRKSGSGRPRKRPLASGEAKANKRSKTGDVANSSPASSNVTNNSSATSTPASTKSTPTTSRKRKSTEGDPKARKMLDLSQGPSLPPHITMPNTPVPPGPHLSSLPSSNLLPPPGVIPSVNSPLLSSALTSKSPLLPTSPSPLTFPVRRYSMPPPPNFHSQLPQTPLTAPSIRYANFRNNGPMSVGMPSLASMLQQPRPSPIIQGGRLFNPPQNLTPTPVNIASTPGIQVGPTPLNITGKYNFDSQSSVMLPPRVMIGGNHAAQLGPTLGNQIAMKSPQSSSGALFNHPHTIVTLATRGSVPSTSIQSATTSSGNKDNVYIVTLPHHQLKHLEGGGSLPFPPNPVMTSMADSLRLPIRPQLVGGTGTQSPTGGQTDRRNVAEILASLSGLMPEPPTSCTMSTPSTPTSTVKSSTGNLVIEPMTSSQLTPTHTTVSNAPSQPSAGGVTITALKSQPPEVPKSVPTSSVTTGTTSTPPTRVVRVLQSSRAVLGAKDTQPTAGSSSEPPQSAAPLPPATTTSGTTCSTVRSRKQIFTTQSSSTDKQGEGDKADAEGAAVTSDQAATPDVPDVSRSTFDANIFDEDFDDAPYTPYSYTKRNKQKKGKPPKK